MNQMSHSRPKVIAHLEVCNPMRRFFLLNVFCTIALSAMSTSPAVAQAQSKTKDAASKATEKAAEKKAEAPAAAPAESRRVPQYFGQVDLTEEQREKIYAVRAKYAAKQDQLEAQLEEIRASVLRESEAVLTPAQKTALSKLRAEAKAKAKAKSKASSKAATKN